MGPCAGEDPAHSRPRGTWLAEPALGRGACRSGLPVRARAASLLRAQGGGHREDGEEEAEGEEADGGGDEAEDDGLDEAHGLVHLAVGAALHGVGNLEEDLVQLVRFLGHGDHRKDLLRDEPAGRQGFRKALAVADGVGGLRDAVSKQVRAGGVLGDAEGGQEGDAVGQHGAQDAAEPGDGEEAEGGPGDGDLESPGLEGAAVLVVAQCSDNGGNGASEDGQDEVPVGTQEARRLEQQLGGEGLLGVGQQGLELGDEEEEGGHHDEGAQGGQQRGVDERAHDLGAQFLKALDEGRERTQDIDEERRAFAGLDHGRVQRGKDVRILPQRLGERLALGHGRTDFLQQFLEVRCGRGLHQGIQRAQEGDARAEEVGELGVHGPEVGGLDAAAGLDGGVRGVALDGDGKEAAFAEDSDGGRLGVGLDGAAGGGSGVGQGAVREAWHAGYKCGAEDDLVRRGHALADLRPTRPREEGGGRWRARPG